MTDNIISPLEYRANLMREGLSYSEAQAVLMASSGHDLYQEEGQIKVINAPPGDPSGDPESTRIILDAISQKLLGEKAISQQRSVNLPVAASVISDGIPPYVDPTGEEPTGRYLNDNNIELQQEVNMADYWSDIPGSSPMGTATQTGIVEGFKDFFGGIGNAFSGIGDILPLFLMMNMFGGGKGMGGIGKLLPMMLMLGMFGGGQSQSVTPAASTTGFTMGNVNASQVALWAMLPKMGTLATMLLGGVSGMIGSSLKPKSRRRTYRRTYRRRWYGRRY